MLLFVVNKLDKKTKFRLRKKGTTVMGENSPKYVVCHNPLPSFFNKNSSKYPKSRIKFC